MTESTLLALTGRDTLDLLHRISTQTLQNLAPGWTRMACFCDFRGRLLHRVWVARGPDDTIWLARPDAPAAGLTAFLDRSIFREDVRVADRSADLAVNWCEPGGITPETLETRDGTPLRMRAAHGPALAVIGAGALESGAVARLDEVARIAAGVAAQGHEIVEDYTPFEVNLADALHLDKGCFTGQEALQRLVTHDRVRRRLYATRGSGVAPAVPADVIRNGAGVGRLTSAAAVAGGWIGLAVLSADLGAAGELALGPGGAIAEARPLPLARQLGRPWAAVD
jgi:folate-binding protein YgfZ